MKQRQHGMVLVGVLTLVAACANGTGDTTSDGGGDGSKPKYDAPYNQDTGSMTCVPSCTNDTDCQSTCPAPPQGAIDCCDLTTNTCFTTNAAVCGGGGPDGGQTD